MRNILKSVMALCLVFSLAACSSNTATEETASDAIFANPGTYSATADGRNGDVTVTLEVTENEIVSINVESEETETIGVAAMNELTDEIINNQSIAVDTVSGATLSCNAYMEALNDCLNQAGADLTKLSGEITADAQEYVTEADVVIVGAGGAGLTAAVTASEAGASVILLEKSNSLGGNTLCAANGINAFDSDVQLADEAYQAADTSYEGIYALQTANDHAKPELVDAFITNSADLINYYSGLGVEFTTDISEDDRNSDTNYYMLKAEADGTTTITMINAITKELANTDVNLYYNMDAYELVQDEDGAVTGVIAKDANGNDVTFNGKAVLLCTGGFGKNNELIAEVNPDLANCVTDEQAPTTGEGLIMAEAVGAGTVDLGEIQTFPVVIEGYGMVTPNKLPGGFPLNGTIYVNNAGERFTAEGFEIPDAILAQDKGEAYAIFTEANLNEWMQQLLDLGYVVSADTPAELAEKLGIDADGLTATIDTWNADAESTGTDSVYGKEEITAFDGTLYGYKFGVGAHYFMGGITIDADTHVLDTDGNIIKGLYAAGEVTGGFHGTQRIDGSGTGDSFVFGRIAGKVTASETAE